MARSRFLPDREALARLLARAGVQDAPAAPTAPLGVEAFTSPGPPAPVVAAPRPPAAAVPPADPADPADTLDAEDDAGLPTIAELDEADLEATVFGVYADTLNMEARLAAFVDWLMGGTGAYAAFVTDTDGLPLTNRNAPESYLAAVGPLGRAQETIARFVPSPVAGSSTVELDHQNVLQVIWSDTSAGRLAVGLVLGGALNRDMVHRIRRITQLSVRARGEA